MAVVATCTTMAVTAGATKAARATTSPRGVDGTGAPSLPSPYATSPPTNTAALPFYAGAMHFRLVLLAFSLPSPTLSFSRSLFSLFLSLKSEHMDGKG
jgi:hypothetical protein